MNSVSENEGENKIMIQNILHTSLFELIFAINNVISKIFEQNQCINYEFDAQWVKKIPTCNTNFPSNCETDQFLVWMTD